MKSYIWKKCILLGNRKKTGSQLYHWGKKDHKKRPLRIPEVIKIMFHFSPLFYISIYCPIVFQKKRIQFLICMVIGNISQNTSN